MTTVVGTGGVVAGVGDRTDDGVGQGGVTDAFVAVVGRAAGVFGVALGMAVLASRKRGVVATRAKGAGGGKHRSIHCRMAKRSARTGAIASSTMRRKIT